MKSINKPVVECAYHIPLWSAHRIKSPFFNELWHNITVKSHDRLLRRRNISHGICPSCERIMDKALKDGN